jgi:hypothetical protein
MRDFLSIPLLDDSICKLWLERHLHPERVKCPRCASPARRLFRDHGHCPASRCRRCDGYDTLLTGTVCENTRQRLATLVLLRGMATGEPTARLAREPGLSRQPRHTLRQRIHGHLNATAPTVAMAGTVFEADALYPKAGEKQHAPSRSRRPATPARQYAPRARHRCERSSPSHQPHRARHRRAAWWVGDQEDRHTCPNLMADHGPSGCTRLSTEDWQRHRGSYRGPAMVSHGLREWARDDTGDGQREVHGHTCEGVGCETGQPGTAPTDVLC